MDELLLTTIGRAISPVFLNEMTEIDLVDFSISILVHLNTVEIIFEG